MGLKLGFYYHVPASIRDGEIVMPGYQGCFVDSLAAYCDKVTCFLHSPVSHDHFIGDYVIRSTNVELVDIGPHNSVPYRMFFAHRYVKPLHKMRSGLDLILLRGPSPLLPAFAKAAGNLPLALLLVGDYLAGIDDKPQPVWRKELIRLWSYYNHNQQMDVACNNLTFVNSHKLYEDLLPFVPNLIETRTTTLSHGDFYNRNDTCLTAPYHLLYTGRMDRTKGLLEMVYALRTLVERGYDCILDLVGMEEKGDSILLEIQKTTEHLGLNERVIYHGYKPLGPSLFEFYHQADIYIIASKSSFEGFPRTIWEAMASSLPVVATRVSSIPSFIEGSAVIIEPANYEALAEGIQFLVDNPNQRQKYIQLGFQLAQENTLERRTQELITHIKTYLQHINDEII